MFHKYKSSYLAWHYEFTCVVGFNEYFPEDKENETDNGW